jgi:hypothetical protein
MPPKFPNGQNNQAMSQQMPPMFSNGQNYQAMVFNQNQHPFHSQQHQQIQEAESPANIAAMFITLNPQVWNAQQSQMQSQQAPLPGFPYGQVHQNMGSRDVDPQKQQILDDTQNQVIDNAQQSHQMQSRQEPPPGFPNGHVHQNMGSRALSAKHSA